MNFRVLRVYHKAIEIRIKSFQSSLPITLTLKYQLEGKVAEIIA